VYESNVFLAVVKLVRSGLYMIKAHMDYIGFDDAPRQRALEDKLKEILGISELTIPQSKDLKYVVRLSMSVLTWKRFRRFFFFRLICCSTRKRDTCAAS